jgi:hypothetical protein
MTKRLRMLMLAALIAGGTAACDDGPSDPGQGGFNELGVEGDLELQVVGDEDLAEVMIEDAAFSMDSPPEAARFGPRRECFQGARRLLREGDATGARVRATECRAALVAEIIEARGEEVVDEWFGRVEAILARIDEADDEFERLEDLEAKLQELLAEAESLRASGDLVGAGERLVLGLQIADRMRHRHHDFVRDPEGHARLAIARGGEAIGLATRLVPEPTVRQEVILFRATEHLRRAGFAFEQGWYRRAVVNARHAEELALFAVLEGEKPTVEDALFVLEVAEGALEAAWEAIQPDPTDAELAVYERARRLKERGEQAINTWHWRGVGLLWHSAVTAHLLIPDESASPTA